MDIETDGIGGDDVGTVPKVGLGVEVTVATVDRVVGVAAAAVEVGARIVADAMDNLARVRSKG